MIYFTFIEILQSIFWFAILGAAFALIFRLCRIAAEYSRMIFLMPHLAALGLSRYKSEMNMQLCQQKESSRTSSREIWHFIFTFAFGIAYIIFCYVIQDGIIRLYTAVITVLSYFSVYRLSARAEKVLNSLFLSVYKYSVMLLCIAVIPLKWLKFILKHVFCIFKSLFVKIFTGWKQINIKEKPK